MSNKELLKLIKEYQDHRMENFHLIYNTFNRLILLYASRIGEKESAQDLSEFLIELLFKMDISKFKSDDSQDVKRYIAVCLRNEYYSMLKKKQNQLSFCSEFTYDVSEITYDFESTLFIKECLANVTENQKTILILRYCYDLSDSQISKKLHISRQAVNKARKKGLETLRAYLSD